MFFLCNKILTFWIIVQIVLSRTTIAYVVTPSSVTRTTRNFQKNRFVHPSQNKCRFNHHTNINNNINNHENVISRWHGCYYRSQNILGLHSLSFFPKQKCFRKSSLEFSRIFPIIARKTSFLFSSSSFSEFSNNNLQDSHKVSNIWNVEIKNNDNYDDATSATVTVSNSDDDSCTVVSSPLRILHRPSKLLQNYFYVSDMMGSRQTLTTTTTSLPMVNTTSVTGVGKLNPQRSRRLSQKQQRQQLQLQQQQWKTISSNNDNIQKVHNNHRCEVLASVVIDVENVRGKSGFDMNHDSFVRCLGQWIQNNSIKDNCDSWMDDPNANRNTHRNKSMLVGKVTAVVDHGHEPSKFWLPSMGYSIVFAGSNPFVKADDVIALDVVPYMMSAVASIFNASLPSASAPIPSTLPSIASKSSTSSTGPRTTLVDSGTARNISSNDFATLNTPYHIMEPRPVVAVVTSDAQLIRRCLQHRNTMFADSCVSIHILSPAILMKELQDIQDEIEKNNNDILDEDYMDDIISKQTINKETLATVDPSFHIGSELLEVEHLLLQRHVNKNRNTNSALLMTAKRRKELVQKRKVLLNSLEEVQKQSFATEMNTTATTVTKQQIILNALEEIHNTNHRRYPDYLDDTIAQELSVFQNMTFLERYVLLKRWKQLLNMESYPNRRSRNSSRSRSLARKETTEDRIVLAERLRLDLLNEQRYGPAFQPPLDAPSISSNTTTTNAKNDAHINTTKTLVVGNDVHANGNVDRELIQNHHYDSNNNHKNWPACSYVLSCSKRSNDSKRSATDIAAPRSNVQFAKSKKYSSPSPRQRNKMLLSNSIVEELTDASPLSSENGDYSTTTMSSPLSSMLTMGSLRLVVISDTHGFEKQLTATPKTGPNLYGNSLAEFDVSTNHDMVDLLPKGDILLHLGDFAIDRYGIDMERTSCRKFDEWLSRQPHPLKIVLRGNHDPLSFPFSASNALYITQPTVQIIAGYKFAFVPYSSTLGNRKVKQKKKKGSMRSDHTFTINSCDIFVSHVPPRNLYVDKCRTGKYAGSRTLRTAVEKMKGGTGRTPFLWLCGHIHEGRGIVRDHIFVPPYETMIVNAANANEGIAKSIRYQPTVLQLGQDVSDSYNYPTNSHANDFNTIETTTSSSSSVSAPVTATAAAATTTTTTANVKQISKKNTVRVVAMEGRFTYLNQWCGSFFRYNYNDEEYDNELLSIHSTSIPTSTSTHISFRRRKVLLAVDLGLRTGMSLYSDDGQLLHCQWFHFQNQDDMEQTIPQLLQEWERILNEFKQFSGSCDSSSAYSTHVITDMTENDILIKSSKNGVHQQQQQPMQQQFWKITHIVIEGHDTFLKTIWKDIIVQNPLGANRRKRLLLFVPPEDWRNDLLSQSERMTAETSKISSRRIAHQIIAQQEQQYQQSFSTTSSLLHLDLFNANNNNNSNNIDTTTATRKATSKSIGERSHVVSSYSKHLQTAKSLQSNLPNRNTKSSTSGSYMDGNDEGIIQTDVAESILLGYHITRRLGWGNLDDF